MQKKIFAVICAMLMIVSFLVGCTEKSAPDEEKKITSADEAYSNGITLSDRLAGKKVGIMTGSAAVLSMEKEYLSTQIVEVDSIGNAVEMLKAGKLDYVLSSRSTCLNFAKNNDELQVIDEQVISGDTTAAYVAVSKGNTELLNNINDIISRYLEDGTMAQIEENWLGENAAYDMSSIPKNPDASVLKVGMDVNDEPMDFVMNGENAGFDCELIERIANELGMRVEYVNMNFPSLIPALKSGKVDVVISDITATDERREMVDFSEPYYSNPQILLTRKSENVAASTETVETASSNSGTFNALAEAKIGVMTGTTAAIFLQKNYPDAKVSEYESAGDSVEALKSNKVDFVMTPYSTAKNFERYNKNELYVSDKAIMKEDVSIAVKKGNTELLKKLDELLDSYQADGTMDAIISNWINSDGGEAPYDTSGIPENPNAPVLKVGIAANNEPTCFVSGDKYCGIDCELIERMAYEMGMRVEYQDMQFAALIAALESGRVDVSISNITATDERRQIVDFTDPYFDNPQVLIMRKSDSTAMGATDERKQIIDSTAPYFDNPNTVLERKTDDNEEAVTESFIDELKASFTRTFITENRWKLILNGLGVTIIISLCAFIIGSLWGGVICLGLRSSKKIASVSASIYVRLLQGTPIVVLLMILYYIVFKSFDISAIIVAIIGFALNLGAYTSEIFRTAIDSVDKGQIEAALAIGFSKFKVFTKIIFPQAARNALPVYKGEFISLVKSTSIVGYIAIQDLTKASDIIRSRTYEAFFPLIATAVIYFVVTYIFIVLLNAVEKKIDPKRRKRTLKGVVLK